MPPRKRSGDGLTAQNLIELTEALAAGKRATVYLIEPTPSLNLAAGCSARVLSVQGTTLMLRPKGVNDELPFEADELRFTRIPPVQAKAKGAKAVPAKAAPAKTAPAKAAPAKAAPAAAAPVKAAVPAKAAQSTAAGPAAPATTPTRPKAPVTAPKTPASMTLVPKPESAPTDGPAAAQAKRARRPKDPASVSVTLHAEAGNEWTVTVTHGERRPGRAAPVSADAVERAVRELGDPAAEQAVASVLSAARDAAAKRVEELSRQLAEAQSTLAALGADGA
ncbi:translation initiation factor [Rhodococcus maanshanensis]|uniref:translation initiation factor n=1 Tax=Rhodococcus maanshanensis TaxID=183556 RepID=UPI0022B5DBA2|nr:translation initiation factor [Rhodococcus maanshanensis]MCZ4555637.1 translation initiation factor [Rhodococcus maanshanensis]